MFKTKTIRQKVIIPAKPHEVYEAFLDPKKHSAFTGGKATGSQKVGGKFTAWDGYISGRNLKLVRGRLIVQEWKTTEWPKGYPASEVEFSFKPKGSGTELTMVHSKVPAEGIESYRQGWIDFYWKPMKKYFSDK